MNLSIIVALTDNFVIGKLNAIPWFLSRDIIWFRRHTLRKVVIMGRKTFESIGSKPLSNRVNIILSRKSIIPKRNTYNLFFAKTPEEALWLVKKISNNNSEVMIIGGEKIYRIFFPQVLRLYLTCINITIPGDTFFPRYERNEWKSVFSKEYSNCFDYSYCFKIFDRL